MYSFVYFNKEMMMSLLQQEVTANYYLDKSRLIYTWRPSLELSAYFIQGPLKEE